MAGIVKIQNDTSPYAPTIKAKYCADFWSKFVGLMLHPPLPIDGAALLVERNDSKINATIHMFFMRFDLCVVWINTAYEVVDVQVARRWRPAYTPEKPARYILETNVANFGKFKVGDRVSFIYE